MAAYGLAWVAQAVLRALGGYVVSPLPVHFRTLAELPAAAPALWRVLDLFGADFHGMRAGIPLIFALAHLASVALVIVALGRCLRRCLRRGVPLVDQVLAVGIVLNLALYLGTMRPRRGRTRSPLSCRTRRRWPAGCSHRRCSRAPRSRSRPTTAGPAGVGRSARAVVGALVLCGYLAGFGYELTFPSSPPANSALASWLPAHGFRSGLATYWQAAASPSTPVTGSRSGR